jgi:hypothetical protein
MAQRFNLEAAISPSVDERAAEREGESLRQSLEESIGDLDMGGEFGEFADAGGPAVGGGGGVGVGGVGAAAGAARGAAGAAGGAAGAGGVAAAASAALPVALVGATAFAIKAGISRLAEASPALRAQASILGEAMDLFFRPVGDAVADTIAPGIDTIRGMAVNFNQNTSEDGLTVAVGALAADAAKSFGGGVRDSLSDVDAGTFYPPALEGMIGVATGFFEEFTGIDLDFGGVGPEDIVEEPLNWDNYITAFNNWDDVIEEVSLPNFVTGVDFREFVDGVNLTEHVSGVSLDRFVSGVDLGEYVGSVSLGEYVSGVNLGNFIDIPDFLSDGDPGGSAPDPDPDPPPSGGGGGGGGGGVGRDPDDPRDAPSANPPGSIPDDGPSGGGGGGTGGRGPPGAPGRIMAQGGVVRRPTRATVGEAGPEVVTPLDDLQRTMSRAVRQAVRGVDSGGGEDVVRAVEELQREMRRTRSAIESLDLEVTPPRDSTDPFNP